MIVSASRRTDIPAFYSDWLLARIRAGYAKTRNPFCATQQKTVSLLPQDVDCLVLWTKDPLPMMDQLDDLEKRGLPFYFQFTLTPYGCELERNLRDKEDIAATFLKLANRIGRERVRWRYDPIVLNDAWTTTRHATEFARWCHRLHTATESVTISFVDRYTRVRSDAIREISAAEMIETAARLAEIAAQYGLAANACCEAVDLTPVGVGNAACIDGALIARIIGYDPNAPKDSGQRSGCGCVQSVDIGAYNTCANGCVYCYASHSAASVARNRLRHNPHCEFLLEAAR